MDRSPTRFRGCRIGVPSRPTIVTVAAPTRATRSRPAQRHGTEYPAPASRTSARDDTVTKVVASATNGRRHRPARGRFHREACPDGVARAIAPERQARIHLREQRLIDRGECGRTRNRRERLPAHGLPATLDPALVVPLARADRSTARADSARPAPQSAPSASARRPRGSARRPLSDCRTQPAQARRRSARRRARAHRGSSIWSCRS